MKMTPYLGFDGNCREAFEFYAAIFGGNIEMILTYGESPMRDKMPASAHNRVMHASLVVDGELLMGGDAPPGQYAKQQGMMIALDIADTGKAKRVFDALAEGGQVNMPFEETFWVERFGMVVDRFGTPWAVNGGKSKVG